MCNLLITFMCAHPRHPGRLVPVDCDDHIHEYMSRTGCDRVIRREFWCMSCLEFAVRGVHARTVEALPLPDAKKEARPAR